MFFCFLFFVLYCECNWLQYQLNCESAEWHHVRQRVFRSRKWLGFANFTPNGLKLNNRKTRALEQETKATVQIDDLIKEAERFAAEAEKIKVEVGFENFLRSFLSLLRVFWLYCLFFSV